MSSDKMVDYQNLGGTLRSKPAHETLAWLQPFLPEFGITRIADITGLDFIGLPVATCIRPSSKHLSVSQGKGATLTLAKISAIMESIEGYHAEHPPEIALQGSYQDLHQAQLLLHPKYYAKPVFSQKDLADITFDWILAHDLYTQEHCYVPQALATLDSVHNCPPNSFLVASSNGLAAGNTFDEALCHALYELIERDCLSRWQRLAEVERDQAKLALATITDDLITAIISTLNENNMAIEIWDISSMLGVPAFHCALSDVNPVSNLTVFTGSGAHIDKHVALSRAVLEAVQTRLTVISGNRDDIFPDFYTDQRLLALDQATDGQKDFAAVIEPVYGDSFAEHLAWIKKQLQANGIGQGYVVDHTKPQFAIPVVQVFLPDLQFNGVRINAS